MMVQKVNLMFYLLGFQIIIKWFKWYSCRYGDKHPPHSLNELIDGLLYLLDNKDASLEEIMQFIKGPDFPTGGIIYGKKGIIEAYRTGRGRVKVRAKTHIEKRQIKMLLL